MDSAVYSNNISPKHRVSTIRKNLSKHHKSLKFICYELYVQFYRFSKTKHVFYDSYNMTEHLTIFALVLVILNSTKKKTYDMFSKYLLEV